MYSHLWTCLQLDGNSLLLQVCIVKYSLFRRIAPLSDSDLGNVPRKREEAKNRWEEKSEWWEEDEPTSEDHHVCPPCRLPLHFLVCLSLPVSGFIHISPHLSHVFFFLCCYFSPLPLLLSVCFLLSSVCHTPCLASLFLQLSLCSFARLCWIPLFLSSSLLNFILTNYTVHIHTFVWIKLKS